MLYAPLIKLWKKPKTYRKKARKAYLIIAKQKRPKKNVIRKAIGKQLRYLKRKLQIVSALSRNAILPLQEKLYTIKRLYEQQLHIYQTKAHQVEERIVSIYQPHVRPIIRGKPRSVVEFGAKIELSVVNECSFLEAMSCDALLREALERYREKNGCYPGTMPADRIYLA